MSQFDVYPNPDVASRDAFPYVVDLQHDLLDHLKTRLVAPLAPAAALGEPAGRLNPETTIADERMIVVTQLVARIPARGLRTPVASMAAQNFELIAALDILTAGV